MESLFRAWIEPWLYMLEFGNEETLKIPNMTEKVFDDLNRLKKRRENV
jgi:hypothetical protein